VVLVRLLVTTVSSPSFSSGARQLVFLNCSVYVLYRMCLRSGGVHKGSRQLGAKAFPNDRISDCGLTREHPLGNTPQAQHPSRIRLSGACATGQKYLKKPSHCSTTTYIFDLAAALRQFEIGLCPSRCTHCEFWSHLTPGAAILPVSPRPLILPL
jgi:hypothetical protein